ncbi:MAG: hypothetical protein ACYDHM_05815 [Acidiferrobacterales bacterium]
MLQETVALSFQYQFGSSNPLLQIPALRHQNTGKRAWSQPDSGIFARTTLALLLAAALAACATTPQTTPRIAVDRARLEQSRYMEFVYTEKRLSAIDYRRTLAHTNTLAPHLKCRRSIRFSGVHPALGAWIWRSGKLLHNPAVARRFLNRAKTHGISSLYLQILPDLRSFAGFLAMAKNLDIKVYALSGSPDDIDDYGPALHTVDQVLAFNRSHTARFSGIQFDVEPYLLKRYRTDKRGVLKRYVGLLQAISARSSGKIPFGVVVPFWFDQETVEHKNLMGIVSKDADSLAIMSYRTHIDQLLAVSNNGLCYAQMYGKPALLGIELRHIPSETHYFLATPRLSRYIRRSGGRTFLQRDPRDFAHFARRYTVRSPEISFYPHVRAAFLYTRSPIPYRSFSGWIMDGLGRAWIR